MDLSILETSEGLFGNKISQVKTLTLTPAAFQSYSLNNCDGVSGCITNLVLKRSGSILNYSREYASLGSVLSEIGGFAKSIFAIVGVICLVYSRFKYRIHFASEIYSINSDQHQQKKQESSQEIELSLRNILIDTDEAKGTKKEIRKLKHSDVGFLTFLIYSLSNCFKRKNAKVKMLEKASSTAREASDILRLFKKLEELERLKRLLLTPEQRMLFELGAQSEKPLEKEIEISEEDYYQAYLKAKKQKGAESIEKKLIEMMDARKLEDFEERSKAEDRENSRKDK